MTDDVRSIIDQLSQMQRNAVVASAVLLPAYRDGGAMQTSLVALRLAHFVPGGAALTALGRRVRTELRSPKR